MNKTIKNNRMKSTIFLTISFLALMLFCQPIAHGQTTPTGKAPVKPISQPTPAATKREKPTDKLTYTPTPTKSVDVEIKKFYIVKEAYWRAPFTAMVHVLNFRKTKIDAVAVRVGVVILDKNKKHLGTLLKPSNSSGKGWHGIDTVKLIESQFDRSWASDATVSLKPGENIIKVPFFPPKPLIESTPWSKPSGGKIPEINERKLGILVNVLHRHYRNLFKEVSYEDFLPEQYIQP